MRFSKLFKRPDERKPDVVYCLGDLVGYNIWPNQVIPEITRPRIVTLTGNHDVKVKKPMRNAIWQELCLITDDNKEYLKALRAYIRLEYMFADEALNILLVHRSPRSNDEYVLEDTDEHYIRGLLFEARTDIILCVHSHKAYHRICSSITGFAHIINRLSWQT